MLNSVQDLFLGVEPPSGVGVDCVAVDGLVQRVNENMLLYDSPSCHQQA